MYCKKCGGKVESYASHCPFCGEPIANNDVQATYTASTPAKSGSSKSIGGWILTYIITAIPLIGIIMLFVWSFGDSTKEDPTFRNWARTELLIMAIALIFVVLIVVIVIAGIISLPDESLAMLI